MEVEQWKAVRAQFAVAPVAYCRESAAVEPAPGGPHCGGLCWMSLVGPLAGYDVRIC